MLISGCEVIYFLFKNKIYICISNFSTGSVITSVKRKEFIFKVYVRLSSESSFTMLKVAENKQNKVKKKNPNFNPMMAIPKMKKLNSVIGLAQHP